MEESPLLYSRSALLALLDEQLDLHLGSSEGDAELGQAGVDSLALYEILLTIDELCSGRLDEGVVLFRVDDIYRVYLTAATQ